MCGVNMYFKSIPNQKKHPCYFCGSKEEVYYLVFNLDKDLPEVYACSKCLSKQYILRKGKINKGE